MNRRHITHIKTIPIGRNRFTVLNPYSDKWTIGFLSYDGRGIVYKLSNGRYFFFPVQVAVRGDPWHQHPLSKHDLYSAFNELMCRAPKEHDPNKYPYKQLSKAESLENEVVEDLKPYLEGFEIRTYDRSGFKLGGCDITISDHKLREPPDQSSILGALCIIEVLGITVYEGKERFNHRFKRLEDWIKRCDEYHILPMFAFKPKGQGILYVVATEKIIRAVFYSQRTKRIRTTYSPVSAILPYSISAEEFSSHIRALADDVSM